MKTSPLGQEVDLCIRRCKNCYARNYLHIHSATEKERQELLRKEVKAQKVLTGNEYG
jgi:hypothetical protein